MSSRTAGICDATTPAASVSDSSVTWASVSRTSASRKLSGTSGSSSSARPDRAAAGPGVPGPERPSQWVASRASPFSTSRAMMLEAPSHTVLTCTSRSKRAVT